MTTTTLITTQKTISAILAQVAGGHRPVLGGALRNCREATYRANPVPYGEVIAALSWPEMEAIAGLGGADVATPADARRAAVALVDEYVARDKRAAYDRASRA